MANTNFTQSIEGFFELDRLLQKIHKGFWSNCCPIDCLVEKRAWGWTQEADKAFSDLKCTMTQAPLLALHNFSQPFVIECDASGTEIGTVLMQSGCPIAFLSHTLGKESHTFHIWRPYFLRRRFVIQIDQKSLRFLLDQRITTLLQEKW